MWLFLVDYRVNISMKYWNYNENEEIKPITIYKTSSLLVNGDYYLLKLIAFDTKTVKTVTISNIIIIPTTEVVGCYIYTIL